MKREIKFRVFDSFKRKFVNFGVGGLRSDYTLDDIFEDNNDSLSRYYFQQFTGVLDKNLKEIYEGDFIRWQNGLLYEVKHGRWRHNDLDTDLYGWHLSRENRETWELDNIGYIVDNIFE